MKWKKLERKGVSSSPKDILYPLTRPYAEFLRHLPELKGLLHARRQEQRIQTRADVAVQAIVDFHEPLVLACNDTIKPILRDFLESTHHSAWNCATRYVVESVLPTDYDTAGDLQALRNTVMQILAADNGYDSEVVLSQAYKWHCKCEGIPPPSQSFPYLFYRLPNTGLPPPPHIQMQQSARRSFAAAPPVEVAMAYFEEGYYPPRTSGLAPAPHVQMQLSARRPVILAPPVQRAVTYNNPGYYPPSASSLPPAPLVQMQMSARRQYTVAPPVQDAMAYVEDGYYTPSASGYWADYEMSARM